MKRNMKKIISLIMAAVLTVGMFAGTGIEAKAATNTYTFYLYCQQCNRNVSGSAVINGKTCATGSTIELNTGSYYDVQIKTIEEGHLVETIKNVQAYANTNFFTPKVFHKQDVTVRVKDANGNPLAGKNVLTDWDGVSGTTDSNGEFRLSTRSIWHLTVTVKDVYGDISKSQTASANGGVMEITIPDRRKVTVNLQATDGTPISGSVMIGGTMAGSTDTKGTYTAIVSDDETITIGGSSIGFEDKTTTIGKDTNDTTVNLKLSLASPKVVTRGNFQPVTSHTMSVGESLTGLMVENNINGFFMTGGTGGATYNWESDNEDVLKVSEGSIQGVSGGTANLKVTANFGSLSKTTYIPVAVNKKDPSISVEVPDYIYGEDQ